MGCRAFCALLMDFASVLKFLLQSSYHTHKTLSRATGLTGSRIIALSKGEGEPPNLDEIDAIADEYGLTAGTLLDLRFEVDEDCVHFRAASPRHSRCIFRNS